MDIGVLVVDDALIIREMIKDALEAAGWSTIGEASNGQEAIERYRELKPDVVTLDLVMPQYDGLHAVKGIKAIDPDAKIIVVSAIDQKEILRKAMQLGAADFIVKPFSADEVIAAVRTVAQGAESALG